ncbi:AIPR family protein [Mycolicibacterium houstonense]|uniref:AIPR family protein n=1 Tax=Mycolicibacterium houstonense TaxID=146021 RepID=UPI000AE9782D|nr:AIPR family protein [Mycolicibacterium houstonense]
MPSNAASTPNEVLLLEGRLAKYRMETYPDSSEPDFFLLSSIDTLMRQWQLSYQQIEAGITEGGDDGGIDAVYTFLNGVLVEDDSPAVYERNQIELHIVQVKSERGYKETALQLLIDHLPLLLQLDAPKGLQVEFNDRLLERLSIFRSTYLAASQTFPELNISVSYVTKSVEEPHAKVLRKKERLQSVLSTCFHDAATTISFVGARELNSRARERLTTIADLRVSEGPISADKGGLVCLVTLAEWYRFITHGESNELRGDIFEENVREYEGDTTINRAIAESLRQGDDSKADFWWLNNGVTVLGARVQQSKKSLVIEDPQIVNGLQTSRNIHHYFSVGSLPESAGEERRLLVRVIEAEDETLASHIIKATNSQNRVSSASLRAAEPFQRSIEEYFSQHGFYYERKKNQYKNLGKPRNQIMEVLELAQAVGAIILCEPHISRGQPSTLVRSPRYDKVFRPSTPLSAFLNSVLIVRYVDAYLDGTEQLNRQERGNVRYQLARAATAFALCSSRPRPQMIGNIDPHGFTPSRLEHVYEWVRIARKAAEKTTGSSDLTVLAKSSEWSKEIDRRLSRYTDKMRWPKTMKSVWGHN